jgi:rSAM/selenodomain-associated transferase 2
MRLSIVVPALDEAANLARLLPELRRVWPDTEIIVADGGSRDGTTDVVRGQVGVRLLEGARGRARQMNAGARQAGGDVLLFLHADTRLPDGAPGAIAAALADPAVVGGRFDVRFDSRRPVLGMVAWFMNVRSRATSICTGDQAIFVRRAEFAGFPEIALMEDVAFSKRMKRRSAPVCLRARVRTSGRRWERRGVLRTVVLMWRLRLAYWLGAAPDELARRYAKEA